MTTQLKYAEYIQFHLLQFIDNRGTSFEVTFRLRVIKTAYLHNVYIFRLSETNLSHTYIEMIRVK